MKSIILYLSFLIFSLSYAQVPPIEDHTWKLEKIVTADSTLVVPQNITFTGIFNDNNGFKFGSCIFTQGNATYDDNNQSFIVDEAGNPFQTCPGEEDLMGIEVFFADHFMINPTPTNGNFYFNPFQYAFSFDNNLIYLNITNNEGSIATFYDNFLSQDNFLKQDLVIYPNPVKDRLFIESPNMALEQVNIYDLSGRLVFEQKNIFDDNLNISHLESGVYILKIKTSVGFVQRKLIIN